jgi:hypothetical protein
MHRFIKLILAALGASLLLASAGGLASARSLSISNQNVRATWSRLEFTGSGIAIRCPVTIEGSYHARTIAKVIGNLKGAIRQVTIKNESCTGGTLAIERPPWHWTYEGFTGTLPNITATRLLMTRRRWILTSSGLRCTYGNETDRVTFTSALSGGTVTSFTPDAGNAIHKVAPSELFCPETVSLSGSEGAEMVSGTTTRLTITLI